MSLLNTYKDGATAQIETDVKNRSLAILRDYRNSWDVYSELVQNSVDAINRKYNILQNSSCNEYGYDFEIEMPEEEFRGKILIEISPTNRTISISDNGTGLQGDKIEKLLLPDGSDKKPGKEYGYKGKGLTYAVFSSKAFKITSNFIGTPDETNMLALDGLFGWVTDSTDSIPFPSSPTPDVINVTDDLGEYNTKIELQLHDNYKEDFSPLACLDNAFSLLDFGNYEAFINLLRTKTAIGNTNILFNKTPIVDIDISLVIYNDDGSIACNESVPYAYAHPKDLVGDTLSFDFTDYVKNELTRAGHDKKFYCLTNIKPDVTIGEKPAITVSVCMSAILKDSLNLINDNLGYDEAMIASGAGYEPGVYLSLNGMPTGIRIANWGDKKGGTYLRYYVIADCSLEVGNELDSGRKGITEYRATQISDYAFSMKDDTIDTSDKFHSYATSELTSERDDRDTRDLFDDEPDDFTKRVIKARTAQKEQDSDPIAQYVIANSSLLHIPDNEEEVRTLFHELLARGIIKGYKTVFDAANRSTYDAALDYCIAVDENNAKGKDPNGYAENILNTCIRKKIPYIDFEIWGKRCKHKAEQVLCAEFKYGLDDLLNDILDIKSTKNPEEIDLVIAWDYSISNEFSQKCTYQNDDSPKSSIYHSVTNDLKITNPRGTNLQCICLKKVIENILEAND